MANLRKELRKFKEQIKGKYSDPMELHREWAYYCYELEHYEEISFEKMEYWSTCAIEKWPKYLLKKGEKCISL